MATVFLFWKARRLESTRKQRQSNGHRRSLGAPSILDRGGSGQRADWDVTKAERKFLDTAAIYCATCIESKKGLIPADGKWLLKFSTRSPLEGIKREIQRRKFQATLKPRIDAEVERWHKSQPPAMPPAERIDDLHVKSPWSNDEQ